MLKSRVDKLPIYLNLKKTGKNPNGGWMSTFWLHRSIFLFLKNKKILCDSWHHKQDQLRENFC